MPARCHGGVVTVATEATLLCKASISQPIRFSILSKHPTGNPFTLWKTFKLANKASPLTRKDSWPGHSTSVREKHHVLLDTEKVDHFVEFADHAHSYQDVAYNKKILKLDNGEKIQMPNVVRTVTRSTMINQWFEFWAEGQFEPLSR